MKNFFLIFALLVGLSAKADQKYLNGVLVDMTQADLQAIANANSNLTPDRLYANAIAAGLTVTDPNGHCPPCVGVWAVDDAAEMHIDSQMSSVQVRGVFTSGQTTRWWANLTNTAAPTFTIAQFTALAALIGQYKDQVVQWHLGLMAGSAVTQPTATMSVP